MRQPPEALVAFFLHLVARLAAQRCAYEARDSAGGPTRDAKRRGAGWVPGLAAMGGSTRRGWDEGCHLLLAVNPVGAMTGWGFGPASTKDPPLAGPFLAWRRHPPPRRPRVGAPARGPSVVAKGVEGQANQAMWRQTSGAQGICPPQRQRRTPGPKSLRRWLAGVRQVVDNGLRQAVAYLSPGPRAAP